MMNKYDIDIKKILLTLCSLIVFSVLMVLAGTLLILKDHAKLFTPSSIKVIFSIFILVFFSMFILYIYQRYVARVKQVNFKDYKAYIIVYSIIFIDVIVSCAIYSEFSSYTLPIAFATLTIAVLLSQRLAIVAGGMILVSLFAICSGAEYLLGEVGHIDIFKIAGILSGFITSVCMTFLVHKGYTRLKITGGAILVGIALTPIGIPFAIFEGGGADAVLQTCLYCFIRSLISVGLTCIALPIYEHIFSIWTDFKLAEICSLRQPLLKELKEKAPGTFSHSLTVSMLAENCAIAIGINPFMAKACAMYHDVGKTKNPEFFIENQDGGYNPHDDLIIDVSVKMITKHPEEGAEILEKAKFSDVIVKAAREHHGDSTLMFFYLKAKGLTEGDLESDSYRYSNPKPSTKYSAIIMICDMAEATLRARKPKTMEELESIVEGIIQGRILDGQFSDCDISLLELRKIKESICSTLPSMLHERIDYDKAKERR